MKSVLISIQPKWCELIANGKKTVEVRKTKPKLETPFKVYIYCTNNGGTLHSAYDGLHFHKSYVGKNDCSCINGKVIGEFVCDWVISIPSWRIKGNTGFCAKRTKREKMLPKMACLSIEEIEKYAGSENRLVYHWCISNLVIYDKPRELSEFYKYNETCQYFYKGNCSNNRFCNYQQHILQGDIEPCVTRLTRPPQSWCYVEHDNPELLGGEGNE